MIDVAFDAAVGSARGDVVDQVRVATVAGDMADAEPHAFVAFLADAMRVALCACFV